MRHATVEGESKEGRFVKMSKLRGLIVDMVTPLGDGGKKVDIEATGLTVTSYCKNEYRGCLCSEFLVKDHF
jgi:hypothetical protein